MAEESAAFAAALASPEARAAFMAFMAGGPQIAGAVSRRSGLARSAAMPRGLRQIAFDDGAGRRPARPIARRVVAKALVVGAGDEIAALGVEVGVEQGGHLRPELGAVALAAEIAQIGERAHHFGKPQELRLVRRRRRRLRR